MPFHLYGSYGIVIIRKAEKCGPARFDIQCVKMESLSSYGGFPAWGNIVSANCITEGQIIILP